MPDVSQLITEGLSLAPTSVDDAPDLFAIFSDPAGWWFDPGARHQDLATTVGFCERAAQRWVAAGLSYWTARDRRDGAVVGLGGVQRHRSGVWNLSYRLAASAQGRGFATELGLAGIRAARTIDAASPVVAWIDEHNGPSRRVAERLGLLDRGLYVDANDAVPRHAYSALPIEAWPPGMRPAAVHG